MTKNKITIQAIVSANKQKTWRYYTQPEHIVHWNFATDDWQCPRASNDLSVGGKYIARMEAKDGSVGFDFEATYKEIIEGEKFTYTMPDSRVVHVRFNGAGDKTEVVITFDAETENSLELQRKGWQAILNSFKEYTEST